MEKIRAAKAKLEAEARAAAAQCAAKDDGPTDDGGQAALEPPAAVPSDKAQRNFTDPESRIMKTKDGFIQGYNAQAAVDSQAQVVVAHDLTNASNDQAQLTPIVEAIKANAGRNPMSFRPMPVTAPRPICGRWRAGASRVTSPRDGRSTAPRPR